MGNLKTAGGITSAPMELANIITFFMNDGGPKPVQENPDRIDLLQTEGVTAEMADLLEAEIIKAGGDIYAKFRMETFEEDSISTKEPIRNLAKDFRMAAMRVLKETVVLNEDTEDALKTYGDAFSRKLVTDAVRPPKHYLDGQVYGIGRVRTAHISAVDPCSQD